jgi:hypothetical protein
MTTFLALITTLRQQIWPEGEAKTLRTAHTGHFKAAMSDLQTWIDELKNNNISVYARCNRLWEDAMTLITAPNGKIQRVYTIVNEDWRDKVYYLSSNRTLLERWAKTLWEAETPENTGMTPELQYGRRYEEEEVDSDIGRARRGIWCIYNGKLYLAPWLQSNEKLVVEWNGVNYEWEDATAVDEEKWDIAVQEAIKLYVKWQSELWFGEKMLAREFGELYAAKRAELMTLFRDKTAQQPIEEIPEAIDYLTQEEMDDDDEASETAGVACDPDDVDVPEETDDASASRPGKYFGESEPEGNQAGCVGSSYTKTSSPRALYFKFSGGCTSSGWILVSGEST